MAVPLPPVPVPLPEPPKKSVRIIVLLVLLFLIFSGAIGIVVYFDTLATLPIVQQWLAIVPKTSQNNIILPPVPPSPTPKPTPSYLPPGKETYIIGKLTDEGKPKINMLTLDPINVKTGEQQSIEVTVNSPTPVTSVQVTLYADDKQKQSTNLTPPPVNGSSTTWRGSWTVQNHVWYRYVVLITAANNVGESKAYVAVRTVGLLKKSELE